VRKEQKVIDDNHFGPFSQIPWRLNSEKPFYRLTFISSPVTTFSAQGVGSPYRMNSADEKMPHF
jgi:hypothetical protein